MITTWLRDGPVVPLRNSISTLTAQILIKFLILMGRARMLVMLRSLSSTLTAYGATFFGHVFVYIEPVGKRK